MRNTKMFPFIALFGVCLSSCSNTISNNNAFSSTPQVFSSSKAPVSSSKSSSSSSKSSSSSIHEHTYSSSWSSDANYHWHDSTCGHDITKDKSTHTWGTPTVVREANCSQKGLTRTSCTICNYYKEEETQINSQNHTYDKTGNCTGCGVFKYKDTLKIENEIPCELKYYPQNGGVSNTYTRFTVNRITFKMQNESSTQFYYFIDVNVTCTYKSTRSRGGYIAFSYKIKSENGNEVLRDSSCPIDKQLEEGESTTIQLSVAFDPSYVKDNNVIWHSFSDKTYVGYGW